MQVKLRLKSIEHGKIRSRAYYHLCRSSQQLGELELKILTAVQGDLNAAEQEARKTIEAFATGLRIATDKNT